MEEIGSRVIGKWETGNCIKVSMPTNATCREELETLMGLQVIKVMNQYIYICIYIAEMNLEIKGVKEWLTINKLPLNIDKTHFMLFRTRNKSIKLKGDLIINGVKISRV